MRWGDENYDEDEANEDDESIQIRTSGSLHKFGLGTAYHWYFTRWDLYAGGGIASYFASADYQDKDLKEYQFSDSDTKLFFLIGFDIISFFLIIILIKL